MRPLAHDPHLLVEQRGPQAYPEVRRDPGEPRRDGVQEAQDLVGSDDVEADEAREGGRSRVAAEGHRRQEGLLVRAFPTLPS